MSTLSRQLTLLSTCKEAVEWAEGYETLAEAWAVCERGDWMLWLCGRMGVEQRDGWPGHKEIVLAACDCAELALPIYEARYPDDDRVRHCLEVTREWAHGRATNEELEMARSAANHASAAATYAAAAAADATYAVAAYAVAAFAAAAFAAAAKAATAYAATYAAATNATTLKQSADICRRRLKPGIL